MAPSNKSVFLAEKVLATLELLDMILLDLSAKEFLQAFQVSRTISGAVYLHHTVIDKTAVACQDLEIC